MDDDPDVRESLQTVLAAEGYDAQAASNGVEALELIATSAAMPAVVLLDMVMSGMNGWEFLAALASGPWTRPPIIVAMSATRMPLPAGASAFLRKPIDLDELVAVVQSAIASADESARVTLDDVRLRTRARRVLTARSFRTVCKA